MKHLVLTTLLALCGSASLLHASSGVPAELVFPAGSGPVSETTQNVAITENFILVGAPKISYRVKAGGIEFNNAGEVLVFSTPTGKFLRRLRASVPGHFANFGSIIAAQGNLAYVLSYGLIIQAIDINTGRTLWTANPGVSSGAIQPKSANVTCLAVDGNTLLAGQPKGWSYDIPQNGFFKEEGMATRIDAFTGEVLDTLNPGFAEENRNLGESVAIAGSIYACGIPNNDKGAIADAGAVSVHFGGINSGAVTLFAADAVAGDHFGASVVITHGRLLVGAPEADVASNFENGKVYVFDAVTLNHITTVNAPGAVGTYGGFGSSMSASGPLVTIGARGSAWLYDVGNNTLVPLYPSFQGTTIRYGEAMAICGNTALVADWSATGGTAQNGRVMRFNQLGRSWGQASALAKTKGNAPGTATVTKFASLGVAALSPMGKAMHLASVTGGGTTAANNAGVWSTQGGTHDLVLRENDAFGTRRVTTPIKPFFNSLGQGNFLGRYTGGSELNLFLDDGTTVTRLAGEGGPSLINAGTETISRLFDVVGCDAASAMAAFSYSSKVGVNNVTAARDTHIGRRTTSLGIVDEAREGFVSPITGMNYGQIAPRLAVNGGRLAFVTTLAGQPTSNNTALIAKTVGMSNTVIAARKGDIAHGTTAGKFSAFLSEAVCPTATVFRATLSGGLPGVSSGVWLHKSPNNGVFAVALRLNQAPDCAVGVKFSRFLQTFVSDDGVIVFMAQLTGPGVNTGNDVGIWARTVTGSLYLVLREGESIAGVPSARLGTLQRFDLGKTGHYTALASLVGTSSTSNQALLYGNLQALKPTVAARKGAFIDRPTPAVLKSLSLGTNHLDATGSGSKGIAKLVNNYGMIFTATFADSVELVVGKP